MTLTADQAVKFLEENPGLGLKNVGDKSIVFLVSEDTLSVEYPSGDELIKSSEFLKQFSRSHFRELNNNEY